MAEQQSLHRQTIQLMETKAEVRDSFLGVIFAFGLVIGCLIACIITVIMVPESAGAICGAVLGVTGNWVYCGGIFEKYSPIRQINA